MHELVFVQDGGHWLRERIEALPLRTGEPGGLRTQAGTPVRDDAAVSHIIRPARSSLRQRERLPIKPGLAQRLPRRPGKVLPALAGRYPIKDKKVCALLPEDGAFPVPQSRARDGEVFGINQIEKLSQRSLRVPARTLAVE